MTLPNETSLQCEECGLFNFKDGIIKDGKIYCEECRKKYVKKCKKHKWRVGSGIGEIIGKRLMRTKLNIWCEKCGKKIKANYFSDYELEGYKKAKKGLNKLKKFRPK